MARLVRFRVLDGIAVVTLDAPPVNALSAPVRAGLWEVFSRVEANPDIKGAILMAAGRMFSAGADIREFGKAAERPTLGQLCRQIEDCSKPVVAAVFGHTLGGGAEIALAAHYRVASPDARIGLPEVALGLVPGAGGTQRLPRLIGAERALQMMVSTSAVDAASAHRVGLVDAIVEGDLGSGAIAFAQNLLSTGQGARPTHDNRSHFFEGHIYQAAVNKARATLAGTPLHAPQRVLDCVEAAAMLPFEAGLAFEQDAFERCLKHPQSIALRHVFTAERKIDDALIEQNGNVFKPVEPMGKSVVLRLREAMHAAGEVLADIGYSEDEIDGAAVAYGFRRGPFGGKVVGENSVPILRRLIAALVVEGADCVEEGAVQRPSDVDALAVHGMGYPRRKGGPMRAAQTMGLIGLRNEMRDWEKDSAIWAVPKMLDEAIKDARGFDALA